MSELHIQGRGVLVAFTSFQCYRSNSSTIYLVILILDVVRDLK